MPTKTPTQTGLGTLAKLPDVVGTPVFGDMLFYDGAVWTMLAGALSVPTAAAGANAGTSPPAPVVVAGSTDQRGSITFGTGTVPAAGAECVVTFGTAFAATPGAVVLVPLNAASAALQMAVTGLSTTGFTCTCNTAPAASQANTVYGFYYFIVK